MHRLRRLRLQIAVAAALLLLAILAVCRAAEAQSLPPVVVETPKKQPKATPKAATKGPTTAPVTQPAAAPAGQSLALDPAATPPGGSLTVPTTAQAQAILARVPGSVVVVPDTAYKYSTPAATLKDVLDYVPGVFIQPKWGEDSRLSIRGSGLSRNFHLRSVQLYMDGIPINTADGYGDFQEIDPTAYRYVEVYKGANALRFGTNSMGGAINFVSPTGRDSSLLAASADVGSFGFHRLQASSGGVNGPFDFFATGSWQEQDGFRNHTWGEVHPRQRQPRLSALAQRRDALLLQRQRHHAAHSRRRDQDGRADVTQDRGGHQRGQRLAAQHRLLAPRQPQRHTAVAIDQRRDRRLSSSTAT